MLRRNTKRNVGTLTEFEFQALTFPSRATLRRRLRLSMAESIPGNLGLNRQVESLHEDIQR